LKGPKRLILFFIEQYTYLCLQTLHDMQISHPYASLSLCVLSTELRESWLHILRCIPDMHETLFEAPKTNLREGDTKHRRQVASVGQTRMMVACMVARDSLGDKLYASEGVLEEQAVMGELNPPCPGLLTTQATVSGWSFQRCQMEKRSTHSLHYFRLGHVT
jgi:hypothetical protein